MTLLPDGDNNVSSDWQPVGTINEWDALQYNDDGTSYVKCDVHNEAMTIEFANPSVAEGDIASIDNVTFLSVGKSSHRTNSAVVAISFEAPAGVSSYVESCAYDAHRTNWEQINGTLRTTSDGIGGTAWTYSDLEDLEMLCTKFLTTEVYLAYLALKVSYTAAAVVTADNATFFGANF